MMIAGLGIDAATLDTLLDILKTPQKSSDFLKSIKKETAALSKARKELGGMNSAKRYTDELKAEATRAIKNSQEAVADIKAEDKKSRTIAKKLADKQIELTALAGKAQDKASHTMRQCEDRVLEISELTEKLGKQEQSVAAKQLRAEALQKEYTEKLNDLKQRMKGL